MTDVTAQINRLHAEILGSLRVNFEKVVQIGEYLEAEKKRLGHGEYEKWVTADLPFSISTAGNYRRAYRNWVKSDKQVTVTDLKTAYRSILKETSPGDDKPVPVPDTKADDLPPVLLAELWGLPDAVKEFNSDVLELMKRRNAQQPLAVAHDAVKDALRTSENPNA